MTSTSSELFQKNGSIQFDMWLLTTWFKLFAAFLAEAITNGLAVMAFCPVKIDGLANGKYPTLAIQIVSVYVPLL